MRRYLAALYVLLSLLTSAIACAQQPLAPNADIWMSVLYNGRKVGYQHSVRQRVGDTIVTTETLAMDIQRNGKSVPYVSASRSVETLDGTPLSYRLSTTLSATETINEGIRLSDGHWQLSNTTSGHTQQQTIDWPAPAVLPEGQRLRELAEATKPGGHYTLRLFSQALQQPVDLDMLVLGREYVSLFGQTETLLHQRQTTETATTKGTDFWLDQNGILRKISINMLGHPLDMIACSQACATAPNQSLDMLAEAMADAPRLLTAEMMVDYLRYRARVDDTDALHPFLETGEQHAMRMRDGEWQVDVYRGFVDNHDRPTPDDTKPTAWLQSDSAEIRGLAKLAAGDAHRARHVMGNLSGFVNRYLTENGLDIGYASALEVARNRRGDCAEYAVLLAALARAEGIPARVVVGMVYAEHYAGHNDVFVPHAWVIAWVGDYWQSFDPALGHFDSSHIALDSGDGNPWRFFNATRQLGHIRLEAIHTGGEVLGGGSPGTVTVSGPAGEQAR